jgi:hypothetical protein
MIIGLNAVIHVLISHGIAIGAFAMIILGERSFGSLAPADQANPAWPSFNKGFMRFVVFTTTILGSVTGAGIWFTTTALAPRGISDMVRLFFWAWFLEYFAFFGEAVVLLLLYYHWDDLVKNQKKRFMRYGYSAIFFSVFSAVSITAILGFMLTPGNWVFDHRFWSGLLNPSYLPQLASRLSFSFLIGALVAIGAVIYWGDTSYREQAVRTFGKVMFVSSALFVVFLLWYYYVTPQAFAGNIPFAVMTSHFSRYTLLLSAANLLFFIILFACARLAISGRLQGVRFLLIPSLVSIVLLVAQFERIREFIRGPYLMPSYMYANSILLDEVPLLQEKGMTNVSPWYQSVYQKDTISRGAFLFGQNCGVCHTESGINSIRDRLKDRSIDGIYVIIGRTHEMVPFMPPFAGNDDERRAMTEYLFRLGKGEIHYRSLSRSMVEEKQ